MWPLDLALYLQSMAQMKSLDMNHCHQVVSIRLKIKRSDFAKSHVKKKH